MTKKTYNETDKKMALAFLESLNRVFKGRIPMEYFEANEQRIRELVLRPLGYRVWFRGPRVKKQKDKYGYVRQPSCTLRENAVAVVFAPRND